ncbi:MAG: peptidoglycan-binding domain-containing protein [Acidimicrobiia bacterium]
MRRFIGMLIVVALLGACGGDDDDDATTDSANTSVARAEARVETAETAVNDAEAAFTSARDAFCAESTDLITVLDRYGQIIDDKAVTVGDVRTGASDLQQARAEAGSSADAAIEAREQLAAANDELTAAAAELDAARAAEASESTEAVPPASETVTTAMTAPPVPEDVVNRVEQAETEFAETVEGIDDTTPLTEAAVGFVSASFAVQVAWLRLFVNAGCIDDEQRAQAITAVVDYTAALQTALQVAGYYTGEIDGIYGPGTVEAVEALQEEAGLPVTGLLDGPTERALEAAVQDQVDTAASGEATHNAAIQGALKVLGYWDGPIDGVWSEELGAAIAELQSDLGIEPTGIVDPATLNALEDALEAAKASLTTPTTTESTTTESTTTESTESTDDSE